MMTPIGLMSSLHFKLMVRLKLSSTVLLKGCTTMLSICVKSTGA